MAERKPSDQDRQRIKQLLVAEAELHRAVLSTEWAGVRSAWDGLASVNAAHRWLDRLRSRPTAWAAASALAGWWLVRGRRSRVAWLPALYGLWRWWRRHAAPLLRQNAHKS
jgi:hypothetical protein